MCFPNVSQLAHKSDFDQISNKLKILSKSRITTIGMVFESWDPKLYDEKSLGSNWVPVWVPFGTQNKTKISRFEQILIFTTQNIATMVHKMVPQWYPECRMVPKWYPGWYPKSLTLFIVWSIFIILRESKNGPEAILTLNLGTMDDIFRKGVMPASWEKKRYEITRLIYLPSLKLLYFCQILSFHLWANFSLLGTIQ